MKTLEIENWTVEKYLNFERAAEQKHELINGALYEMAGASEIHNDIVFNISDGLATTLKQIVGVNFRRQYKIRVGDMRVYNPLSGDFFYPDLVILKEHSLLLDVHKDTLLNPLIIFEVLSFSTEKIDRTLKKEAYESIESLSDYLIVSQTEIPVERFTKNESGQWNAPVLYTERSEKIDFVFCIISLDEIYNEINL